VRSISLILVILLVAAVAAGVYFWWPLSVENGADQRVSPSTRPVADTNRVLRIGLVPEYDVFALRRSYQGVTKYLSQKLGRPVEVVTLTSYQAVLADFQERQIDGAFLGSLVALLAMDRYGAQVLVKPEQPGGVSTYRGVIFVRADSPIRSLDDLGGQSIAMLRATYAGSLFPISELVQRNLIMGHAAPRIIWMGTHDEVIDAVVSGRAAVGAVKDLRLDIFEKSHSNETLRRLATSKGVPNNALVMRSDLSKQLGQQIAQVLQEMDNDPEGRQALANLGAKRFVACSRDQYDPIYEMTESVGPAWALVGVTGEAPKRPKAK
jgi:phosphonate transport system substrate-binding protein